MKIRSVTCFFDPAASQVNSILKKTADLSENARRRYQDAGYEVQSTRLATPPFPLALPGLTREAAVEFAVAMQTHAQHHGFRYVSLGPALITFPESYRLVAPMLAATNSVFLSGEIANQEAGVSLSAVHACGEIIAQAAQITPDGFTNLRFGAMANVAPYGPFFPAAYALKAAPPSFGLAIEAADLVLAIFQRARSLAEARKRLVQTLETQAHNLAVIAEDLAQAFEFEFKGIDISLAPYPEAMCSLGAALEQLGPVKLGLSGSLAAAAFLADALDEGQWKRTGFNGMMLPVLEDSSLAERAAGGTLTIKDLLLYSTVCGTGLDTIPLPGDAAPEQLSAVMADVAALSSRLGKPLTARLMPIPGKKAGDAIHFNFDYFADGRIMDLPALPLRGLLGGAEGFRLHPRRPALT
jgi:uncharacterized protein